MASFSLSRPLHIQGGFSALVKHWTMSRAKQRATFALLVLIVVSLLLIGLRSSNSQPSTAGLSALSSYSVQLNPTLEARAGTQLVWQIPEGAKSVLFIAHGCSCKATNFWDEHDNCPTCIGLPEDRLLVLEALQRGYAVIAISSKQQCWNYKGDGGYVKEILKAWIEENGLGALPLSALGASSGGFFVSNLALELEFKSLVLMISPGSFFSPQFGSIKPTYPPSLFVHMPKDGVTATRVRKAMQLLNRTGIRTAEIKCYEFPVTPLFFSDRIPGLSRQLSEKIYSVFKDSGLLDQGGFLRMDGRKSNWQMPIKKRNVLPQARGRLRWENHIQEELNVAYALHEMTSFESKYIFDWMDDQNSFSVE